MGGVASFRFPLRLGCVGLRQPDSAVGVCEMLGEMLSVWRADSGKPLAVLTKLEQNIDADGIQLPQVKH